MWSAPESEIGDAVVLAARGRAVAEQEDEGVAATAAGQTSTPEPPINLSLPSPPISVSLPPPPDSVQPESFAISVSLPLPPMAFSMIALSAIPILLTRPPTEEKAPGVQVDGLRRRIAGAIERVVAAAVIDRQRRRRAVVAEIEDRAGIAVEAVDGIAGSRRGRRAVDQIHGVDVRHLRRDHVTVRTPGVIVLREIRHDGILPGVVGIDRVGRIRRAAIVRPLVAEAERMPDFVDVGLVAVAVDAGLAVIRAAVIGDPVGADVDGREVIAPRRTRSRWYRPASCRCG